MAVKTHGTDGRKLDIDRLCEAITDSDNVERMLPSLKEHFPTIVWMKGPAGELRAAVHAGYRP